MFHGPVYFYASWIIRTGKGKKRREEEWPCHWSILTLSQLLTYTSSPPYKISSWLIFLIPPQGIFCDSLSSLVFTPSRWVLCLLTDLNIYICLWSPVDLLPFPLSFSICSHLFFGCKLAGESNGQALQAARRKFHKSCLLEGILVSPLSLCWHIYNPRSPASEAQHHPPLSSQHHSSLLCSLHKESDDSQGSSPRLPSGHCLPFSDPSYMSLMSPSTHP